MSRQDAADLRKPWPIATRNGHPAYLNAPPRLTQSMVDLDRDIRVHRSHLCLVEDEPASDGSVFDWFLIGAMVAAVLLVAAFS